MSYVYFSVQIPFRKLNSEELSCLYFEVRDANSSLFEFSHFFFSRNTSPIMKVSQNIKFFFPISGRKNNIDHGDLKEAYLSWVTQRNLRKNSMSSIQFINTYGNEPSTVIEKKPLCTEINFFS